MKNLTPLLRSAIIDGNRESILVAKSIRSGIYLHVYAPTEDIYENRTSGTNDIVAGTVVIKPGKFSSSIYNRCKSYNSAWKLKSDDSPCFLHGQVTTYLIADLSAYSSSYAGRVEESLAPIRDSIFKDCIKYEGSKSEYRKLVDTSDLLLKIKKFKNIVAEMIDHDMSLELNRNLFLQF
jgi:hypothetical protein